MYKKIITKIFKLFNYFKFKKLKSKERISDYGC